MHVIGHDHPGSELIKMPSALAIQESISHHARYPVIPQPNRSEGSLVHFAVQGEEGAAGGSRCGSGRLRQASPRNGTGQAPSNKQEGCLSQIIGMPVGKLSAIEHNGLAGESACPTHSAQARGKSQKNVETPDPSEARTTTPLRVSADTAVRAIRRSARRLTTPARSATPTWPAAPRWRAPRRAA